MTVVVLFNPHQGNKMVHDFLKGISPKVNVIAQLDFERDHYDVVVSYVNYNITETLPIKMN